ncbi:hypothetical protein [Paenibacillus sp. 22594]|uniref:hypothetical protein n=1 Tax=Paenibacillus sp. 22594 TaxID=3453947 RepID=UPI003F87F75B
MNLKKLGLSLVIASFFIAPTSIYADSNQEEADVINTIQTYYTAEKNHDLSTMLNTSTDSYFPDQETKEYYLGGPSKQLLSFEVSDVEKLSDTEYTANIDVTYDDNVDYPKYPIHVVKEDNSWQLNLEQVAFLKDSNDNWYYEIINSPIDSINKVTVFSTINTGSWTLPGGSSTYTGSDFTYNSLYNLTINGWQQPVSDFSQQAYIEYDLMLKTGSSSYSTASALSYYSTVYQSGQWFNMQFNNVVNGATYKVLVKNLSSISCNGAFNIYN